MKKKIHDNKLFIYCVIKLYAETMGVVSAGC